MIWETIQYGYTAFTLWLSKEDTSRL